MVILEFLKSMIDNFGAAIIVPVIIGIIALFFRVKPQKAFLSALYAGVSLEGISLMVGAFTPIITPLVKNMAFPLVSTHSFQWFLLQHLSICPLLANAYRHLEILHIDILVSKNLSLSSYP